jgi:hypothetical protein
VTDLTYDQAQQALLDLMNNPPPEGVTLEKLREIGRQISIEQLVAPPPDAITVLYSGNLVPDFLGPGVNLNSNKLAVELAAASEKFQIIDNTHAGNFLSSDEFFDAVVVALENELVDPNEIVKTARSLIYGSGGGFFSEASERFAQSAKDGDVFVIAPSPHSALGRRLISGDP